MIKKAIASCCLMCLIVLMVISPAASALPLGMGFNYQGKLNQGGVPYDGTADFEFALYDASSGNGQIGTPQAKLDIDVAAGLFTAENINFGTVFDGNERWLEVRVHTPSNNGVGPYTTLTPRQLLRAVPYASYALSSAIAGSSGDATQLGGQPASYYTNASNLTGTLPSASLNGTYSGLLSLSNPANVINGNGAGITNINATNIISGTLNPAQLPNGGVAGGDLTGSYPNPLIANGAVTDAKIASVAWSKITGVPSELASPSWAPTPNQDQQLVGWGYNWEGKATVPSGTFTAVDGGWEHSVGLRTDGTLIAWGGNSQGQLDNIPTGTFTSIAANNHFSLAIRTDGTLAAWGSNGAGQLNVPSGTFTAVAAGWEHGLAIHTDGTLAAWGSNANGQTNVPPGTFKAIAGGYNYSLAIRTDGTLVAWGANDLGQLGIPSGTFVAIASGWYHGVAIRTDGTLVAWGNNKDGETNCPTGTFVAVAAGDWFCLAIKTGGTLAAWGNNFDFSIGGVPSGFFSQVAAGTDHGLAIASDAALVYVDTPVGIGTSTPTNTLSVGGNADFSGNVSIGTAQSEQALNVVGRADFNGDVGITASLGVNANLSVGGDIVVHNKSYFHSGVHFYDSAHYYSGFTASGDVNFYDGVGVSGNANVGGNFGVGGNVGIGTSSPANKLSVVGSANVTGNLGIGTTAPTNKLSVVGNADLSGNVGIGTGTPSAKLHVADGSAGLAPHAESSLVLEKNTNHFLSILAPNGNYSGILFGKPDGGTATGGVIFNETLTPSGFQFRTGGNQNRMVIDSAGNVGIGTVTPASKLTVAGTGDFTAGLVVDSAGANNGSVTSNALRFGGTSGGFGEGIASKRTVGDNQFGLDFYTASLNRMSIANSGNVGINTSAPTATLSVNGTANKPGGGSWATFSDIRLKKNVDGLHGSLDSLLSLRGVTFEYIDPCDIDEASGTHIGMIAQEVEKVFPQWVSDTSNGYKQLSFSGFEALTVEALRDLRNEKDAQIAEQSKRINALESENAELKARLDAIEKALANLHSKEREQ